MRCCAARNELAGTVSLDVRLPRARGVRVVGHRRRSRLQRNPNGGGHPAKLAARGHRNCRADGVLQCDGVCPRLHALVTSDRDTRWDDGGTTLRVNPSIAWCYGVALLGGLVGSACYLVLSWWGDSGRLPLAAAGNGGVARFLMAALLMLSAGGLIALLRTREPGRLRIDVDGITHFDILRTRTASWSEVESVTDEAGRRVRNPVVFTVRNGKPIVVSNADRYGSGGAAAYWLARHYWRHPADRGELVDGRALERLREGGFGPV